MVVRLIAVLGVSMAVVAAPAYAGAKPKVTHTPKAADDSPTWSPPSYDANSYTEHIESYDVKLQVQRDGSMHVTEAIKYNFGDGPYPDAMPGQHHGIIRKISTHRHVDGRHDRVIQIRNPQVQGEGIDPADLAVSHSGGDEVLKIGSPDTTVSGVKTYVIDYDVPRVLTPRGEGTDELYWDAIGTRWTVPISKATVTMTAPVNITSAGCYRGFEGDASPCSGPTTTTGTTLKAGDYNLSTGEGITLKAELPQAGMASVLPPPLVRRPAPFGFTAAAGIFFLLAIGIVAGFAWLCMARPVRRRGRPATEVGSPPVGMTPGLAGLLRNDGSVGARQVTAILVDLATRGHLRFEETKVSKKEIGRKLVRGERATDDLEPYEAKAIDVALGAKRAFDRRDEITLAALRRRDWERWKEVGDLLEREACRRGWFRWRHGVQRAVGAWTTVGLVVVGVVSLLSMTSGTVGGVPTAGFGWAAVTFFAGAVAVGILSRWPARTAAGARATAEANAYADELNTWARRPNDPEVDAALISLVFPYAVAFGQANGFTSDWRKVFDQLDGELPWYVPAKGSDGKAARRIETLANIVDEPRPRLRPPGPRSSGPSRRSSSYRTSTTYTTSSWTSSSSSGGWSSGGGFSGDSGGGSIGGGDGGGGGSSW